MTASSDQGAKGTPAGGDRPPRRLDPTTSTFWLLVAGAPDAVAVRLEGALDLGAWARLGDILTDLIVGQGNLTVVVDLRTVGPIDPDGLKVLAEAAAAVEPRGGALTVTGPGTEIVGAFRAAGLARLIGSTAERQDRRPESPDATTSRSRHPAGSARGKRNPGKIA